MTHTYRRIL